MARTTTPRNSNRGGVAEATTVQTSPPSATRLDRRQVSPPSDNSIAEQLTTPTRKRSTPAARRTNGTASVGVYDAPGDDGRDVFENSRKTDERYLSVATAHKPNGSRSSRKRKATSAEPPVTTNLDEEIDDRGEDGMHANGHGDDGEEKDSDDGPAHSLSVAAETALDSAIDDEPRVAGPVETPRKRGRPPKARFADRFDSPGRSVEQTPTSKRRRTGDAFATPTKSTPTKAARGSVAQTPNTRRTLADRSARKKSTRALIDRMVAGADDDDEDEAALNDAILDADDEDGEDDEDPEAAAEPAAFELGQDPPAVLEAHEAALDAPTPRKRGRPPKAKGAATPAKAAPAVPGANGQPAKRGRGRPRKTDTGPSTSTAAARDTTPPRDLPAHEHYFFQNRAGAGIKTSNNTLAALRLLTYDEYFRLRDGGADNIVNRHEKQIGYLEELHSQSFAQWAFELSQGFSVCLYGYGSKQRVLRAFATALHKGIRDHDAHKIVMVNTSTAGAAAAAPSTTGGSMGMTASAAASTLRDIMLVVAAAAAGVASTNGKDAAHTAAPKLPSGLAAAERIVMSLLDKAGKAESAFRATLIISGIDSPSLRRPAAQATLARLAAHRSISLLCAADTPGFPLLWDGAARSQQNFVFHDATTFRPLAGLDTVDEVHALLGRRVRRVGGKDGAAFVLRSLPENARTLFQLLVGEVLAADEGQRGGGGGAGGFGYDDEDDEYGDNDGGDHDDGAGESVALEYRMLYNKAVEEFICSSEMAFRTLLKEFHDHQMVLSRKDAFGTEMLSLPFRRDELEALLEDLAS
ncbi:origin recognition complex subunit 2 [Sporothrix schenckii 1099-18]|uniref:Origin recognition complex subunit 2 n=1 Tax=Sporothrix schenckii 1099-18 TaxID=1397361 RepID=A0A0F2LVM6_SPOSC|nr:origin recognition complex subunit 2 [Sporothrix schenckii 1099-18]KJR80545.1 origin recognition complex subunit 2 [Sporothrix schenckii 1099-18]